LVLLFRSRSTNFQLLINQYSWSPLKSPVSQTDKDNCWKSSLMKFLFVAFVVNGSWSLFTIICAIVAVNNTKLTVVRAYCNHNLTVLYYKYKKTSFLITFTENLTLLPLT